MRYPKRSKDFKKFIKDAFTDINELNEFVDLYEKTIGAIDALVAGEKQKFIGEWNAIAEELKQRINTLQKP